MLHGQCDGPCEEMPYHFTSSTQRTLFPYDCIHCMRWLCGQPVSCLCTTFVSAAHRPTLIISSHLHSTRAGVIVRVCCDLCTLCKIKACPLMTMVIGIITGVDGLLTRSVCTPASCSVVRISGKCGVLDCG